MLCVDLIVEGSAGRAMRFTRHHLPEGFIDQWVIELDEPRMFWQQHANPTLRSQMSLIVAPIAVLTPQRGRQDRSPTHGAVLAIPEPRFDVGKMDSRPAMQFLPHPVGYFEGTLSDPHAGRLVGHTLAACIAKGDLHVGSRSSASAYAAAAGAAFRCADMVTVMRQAPTHATGGGSGEADDHE